MVRVLVFALLFCAVFPTDADCREPDYSGAIWEKTIKARQGQPRSCFYGTVTGRSDQEYSNATLTIGFTKLSSDHKYAEAQFSFLPWKRMKDFKLEDGYGDVLEACVSPGRYSIPGLLYSTGSYAVGPYSASRPRNFAPIEFELEAGKNYYIGNIEVLPQHLLVHDRFDRDKPLIEKFAKHRPDSELQVSILDTGSNAAIRRE